MAEDKKKEEIAVIDITEEYLKERIYEIRGQRVILDADLSEIYGYTTKAFNQQVKNNIEKFDGRKDIRAWLFVIAKNTYFRYCRRNKIYVGEEFSEIMQDSMQDTSPAVLDQIVQDETVRNLKRYAELIPEPYREVFHLRIYGEFSFEQIGKCYQKSAGWARVTYHRARQMIRAEISQEEK